MKPSSPRPAPPRRRLPAWLWVTPLVLAAHGLLFWAVAHQPFMPKPWGGGRRMPTAPRSEPNFSAREEPANDPQTGEPTIRREFTVSTRLTQPPRPAPSASP